VSAVHDKISDSWYGLDNPGLKTRNFMNDKVAVLARGISSADINCSRCSGHIHFEDRIDKRGLAGVSL